MVYGEKMSIMQKFARDKIQMFSFWIVSPEHNTVWGKGNPFHKRHNLYYQLNRWQTKKVFYRSNHCLKSLCTCSFFGALAWNFQANCTLLTLTHEPSSMFGCCDITMTNFQTCRINITAVRKKKLPAAKTFTQSGMIFFFFLPDAFISLVSFFITKNAFIG